MLQGVSRLGDPQEQAVDLGHNKGAIKLWVYTEYAPNYLCEDDSWVAAFFKPGTLKCLRRLTFMGLRNQARTAGARR